MPILLDNAAYSPYEGTKRSRFKTLLQSADPNAPDLTIGLINNMPDLAIEGTERQFIGLLEAASDDICVHLKLYSLPGLLRSDWGREYLSTSYSDIDKLWSARLDALIVTGTEPHASDLRDEPYWSILTEVIDWAERNTISTIWSCLAAHAAVLYIDGISRAPLSAKCFGVFEFEQASNHRILRHQPARWRTPHSRWNELQERALTSCGYSVLAKSFDAGVDMFLRHGQSLFIYFQGHPEYAEDTLLREYRRDIGRFLRGERNHYPNMPQGYFDERETDLLDAFREQALTDPQEQLLATFPDARLRLKATNTWKSQATQIYRDWLSYVFERSAKADAGLRAR